MKVEDSIIAIFGYAVPVSGGTYRMWESANQDDLIGAFEKIKTHNANLWAFGADERHFEQFAEDADVRALAALSANEYAALIGSV